MNFFEKIKKAFLLFGRAFGGYKKQIFILTGVGFLSGILEGVGANALIPLFSFITGGQGGDDTISKLIEKLFHFGNIDFTLKYLLVFIVLLFVLKAVVLFFGSYIQFWITFDYEKQTRADLFQKAMRSGWPHLMKQKIGHLEKVLSTEVQVVARLLRTISSSILVLTGLAVYIFVAINISLHTTLFALLFGGFIVLIFYPILGRMRFLSKSLAEKLRETAHFINENVLGMKTIKTMSVEGPSVLAGNKQFESLRKLELKKSFMGSVFSIFFQPIGVIFILVLFSFSYKMQTFNLAAFIAIFYLIQRIFTRVQDIQASVQTMWSSLPYLEHVLGYQEKMRRSKEEDNGTKPFKFNNALLFKNIHFSYSVGKKILSDISFTLRRGSFVGLIGPSGVGKTTLVDLILRLFVPDSGFVYLDDTDISEISLHQWRKNIGYVSQDIHLINDTIANNIRFFDETITDEDIVRAAKQAHIYDTIGALPNKFSSVVGERGIRLSAGQRQRIVIARVLARSPQLLILDEATSALDNESEIKIQKVIENLKGKMTVLVIAHRLGTVMNCDNLFILDNGHITEEGSPQELLKNKDSYFFKMYNIR